MSVAEKYMDRCMELASNALGNVAPNPMVGCIIVNDGKIIGEGFHQRFGEAHAEVNAISSVIEKHGEAILEKSELYVSLEPCTHYGKTPPCTDLIIKHKIPGVTIGCTDTFSEVNGAGIKKLRQAGVKVTSGILENECRELNKRFFTFHEKKRPYIILKWAQSMDGFIAPKNQTDENRWISNAFSRKLTHKWRSEEQAILVGANTVAIDNPHLTVRDWNGRNPVRIVVDDADNLPEESHVLDHAAATLVMNNSKKMTRKNIEWIPLDLTGRPVESILYELYNRKIQSIIVEGGAMTLANFIGQNCWDEARIFHAAKFIGHGVSAPHIDYSKKIHEENLADDKLITLRNN